MLYMTLNAEKFCLDRKCQCGLYNYYIFHNAFGEPEG